MILNVLSLMENTRDIAQTTPDLSSLPGGATSMFWTIFFAVLAAMAAPMVVAWLAIGAVGLAGFFARMSVNQRVGFVAVGVIALALPWVVGR